MTRWHLWRYLSDRHPDVVMTSHQVLPDGNRGTLTRDGIALAPRMLQTERRCTLTH